MSAKIYKHTDTFVNVKVIIKLTSTLFLIPLQEGIIPQCGPIFNYWNGRGELQVQDLIWPWSKLGDLRTDGQFTCSSRAEPKGQTVEKLNSLLPKVPWILCTIALPTCRVMQLGNYYYCCHHLSSREIPLLGALSIALSMCIAKDSTSFILTVQE